MAKAPKPGTTSKKERQAIIIGFGEKWRLSADEISPKDGNDLRRAAGLTVQDVFVSLADGSADIGIAAALLFLARRQSEGRWVSYDYATDGLLQGDLLAGKFLIELEEESSNGSSSNGSGDDGPEA